MSSLLNDFRSVYKFRFVIYSFIETNLKIRYRRSYLGFFWTLLAPIMHYLVIGFVFSILLKNQRPNYFLFYFSGALLFSFVNGVLGKAPYFFISNEHFIKKVSLPKLVFILNGTCYEFVNFIISAFSLLVLSILFKFYIFNVSFFWSFLSLFLLAFFLFGMACIIAITTIYFRDFFHIIPVVLQALFFVSPVIYSLDMVPEKYHIFIYFNPLYYYLELFRTPLIEGQLPNLNTTSICVALSVCSVVFGLFLIKKFENRIIFKL